MRTPGVPIGAFDPEGIIFAAGIDNTSIKLFDIRTFDKGCFSSFAIHPDRNSGKSAEWTNLEFSKDGQQVSLCHFFCKDDEKLRSSLRQMAIT